MGLMAAFLWRLSQGMHWETDILKLLPKTEQDPVAEQAITTFAQRVGQKNIFLIGHTNLEKALEASDLFGAEVKASGLFENFVSGTEEMGEKAFFDVYFPFRYGLLDEETRDHLRQPDAASWLTRRAEEMLYGPMSSAVSSFLADDPLLVFPGFIQNFPKPPTRLELHEGRVLVNQMDRNYILVTADLKGNAFSPGVQRQVIAALDELEAGLKRTYPGLDILSTGVIRYAHSGTQSAKNEISTIGTGSLLGILILLLGTFRSWRPLVLSLLPIGIGCLFAITLTFFWFGQIHILTLVFGATLIGVCIDYSFHFFCECFFSKENPTPANAMSKILPAISLGAITSVFGYAALFFAPFPGLKQMAVFSSLGLLGAFATVVCWFPVLQRSCGTKQPPLLHRFTQGYLGYWQMLRKGTLVSVLGTLIVIAAIAAFMVEPQDDIRLLQNRPEHLVYQEETIRSWVGGVDTSRFLLVEGATVEDMLLRSEALHSSLGMAKDQGALAFFQGLYQWVPSQRQQSSNHALLKAAFRDKLSVLDAYFENLGFHEETRAAFKGVLNQADIDVLKLTDWLESPASLPFRHLWLGETERGVASMILLGDVDNAALLEALASNHEGVTYIDKVKDVSNLFARYRELASQWVAIAYLGIFLLLALRYGWTKACLIIIPPLLAALVALLVVSFFGVAINLFSILALLLVLAIGIDYTIFLGETGSAPGTTMLAIVLSSITTLLSFGLLALSQTPVLRGFGLTMLVGITLAMLMAPLVITRGKGTSPNKEEFL